MFRKVLPLISLGLMCSAEAPAHTHSPHSEKSSEHAISTQAFHRDDVPLSYKYSSIHIYTTAKPQPQAKKLSHNTYSAEPSYFYNDKHHQSGDINQYRHYIPVETVLSQKPEPQTAQLSYEVNDYEENSPNPQTKYEQPQLAVSEHKQYYRPSYLQAPATSSEGLQVASIVKIPSHNYLQYNQKQSSQPTRPAHNYLPVTLYQPHQQASSASAQQQTEYQPHESPEKNTVLLYSVIPSSQHKHTPNRYQNSASAPQYTAKPTGAPLVYFKVGQSNGHSSPYYTNAKAHTEPAAAAHTQEASTHQYNIKPSPYMFLLQKHRELISNHKSE